MLYVCTRADIWSTQNKSYLGVTVHVIDNKNFERKSFVLCCKRFKFAHNFDKIAGVTNEVHTFYDVKIDKISETVTDNARNFSKAFNVFSMSLSDTNVNNDNDNFAEFPELKNSNEVNVETFPYFDKEATLVFKKVFHIWNLASRSTKASDEIEKVCGIKLTVPCATRWKSTFDALCGFSFFKEFIMVTKPIAVAIDILQGEKNCNLGAVLPTLYKVKNSVNDKTNLEFCNKLKECILSGFAKRFSKIMDLKSSTSLPYLMASISNPKFKLR
ncbi:hypothetical protein ILUMI_06205 [Ignelater luminosus]|uniref:Uncharacterized protein n=1 Tax=Ignelater luminosus TaxID=2038154 RepID=A0A8K0GJC0_IGNLU|nr:hypothetical protein ILUMI_06205 [Ignelater luminosus]